MIISGELTREEIQFLKGLGVSGDLYHLTNESDEWIEIEDKAGDELIYEGLDENYEPNQIGQICESILDKIPIEGDPKWLKEKHVK